MKLGHNFNHGSGVAANDFACVAYRYPGEQLVVGEAESWILQVTPKDTFLSQARLAFYTGLWRSPSGKLFVSDNTGTVRTGAPGKAGQAATWTDRPMPRKAWLEGITGLADNFVLTWGKTAEQEPVLFRFDGQIWHEEKSPGEVVAMQGTSEDLFYAVGHKGLIARRNGSDWQPARTPDGITFLSIQVVSKEEMWATAQGGRLFKGSIHGWSEVLKWEQSALRAAAKFQGQLWVAAGAAGLHTLHGSTLKLEKDNLPAERLELHQQGMLVTSPSAVAFTTDGKIFQGTGVGQFKILAERAQLKPLWELAQGPEAVDPGDRG